jgi:hypothetical protein
LLISDDIHILAWQSNQIFVSISSILYCCTAVFYTVLHVDAGRHSRDTDVCFVFHI